MVDPAGLEPATPLLRRPDSLAGKARVNSRAYRDEVFWPLELAGFEATESIPSGHSSSPSFLLNAC